jgi:hypothetical protein
MSPMARRGRKFFLVLIAPIVVDCAAAIVVALCGDWQSIQWTASVLMPLWIVGWLGFLYLRGYRSSLFLVEFFCLVPGIGLIKRGIRGNSLVHGGAWGHLAGCPSIVVVAIGAWYLTAGLALMLLPSVRAYFAHQREKAAAAMNPTTAE